MSMTDKKITKRVKINSDRFFLIKKITVISAFSITCLSLIAILLGAVPFRGRMTSLIPAINGALEFVNIGRTSILYSASCVTFSAFYIYSVIRILIDIILSLTKIKLWLLSDEDSKDNRSYTGTIIIRANSAVLRLLFLFMLSYVISAYTFSGFNILVIGLFLAFFLAINFTKNLIYKCELVDTLVVTLNRFLILAVTLFFAFSSNFQILEIFSSLGKTLSVLGTDATSEFIGQLFCQSVLMPTFYFVTWICLVVFNNKINLDIYYGDKSAKKLAITNTVFLVLFMIMMGWSNRYTDIFKYLQMLWSQAVLIFTVALVYVSSMNTDFECQDVNTYNKCLRNSENSSDNSTGNLNSDIKA